MQTTVQGVDLESCSNSAAILRVIGAVESGRVNLTGTARLRLRSSGSWHTATEVFRASNALDRKGQTLIWFRPNFAQSRWNLFWNPRGEEPATHPLSPTLPATDSPSLPDSVG